MLFNRPCAAVIVKVEWKYRTRLTLVSAKKCHYKNQFDKMGEVNMKALGGIIDIEELVAWGTEKECCPYYLGISSNCYVTKIKQVAK